MKKNKREKIEGSLFFSQGKIMAPAITMRGEMVFFRVVMGDYKSDETAG